MPNPNVKIGRLPKREVAPTSPESPYDLVRVKIGDEFTEARPYDFINLDTNPKAVKVIACCPKCSQTVDASIVGLTKTDGYYSLPCESCGAGVVAVPEFVNPFVDPIVNHIVKEDYLCETVVIKPLTVNKLTTAIPAKYFQPGADGPPEASPVATERREAPETPSEALEAENNAPDFSGEWVDGKKDEAPVIIPIDEPGVDDLFNELIKPKE